MRNNIGFVIFSLFLCMGGSAFCQVLPNSMIREPISIRIPVPALDLSDLDIRDSNNRRIQSPALRQEMENLFNSNLSQMLLANLTPSNRIINAFLASFWNAAHGVFVRIVRASFKIVYGWLQKKEFERPALNRSYRILNSFDEATRGSIFWHQAYSTFLTHLIVSTQQILR